MGVAVLAALKWITDIGASFVMLNRTGRVLLAIGPNASSDVRLRRAQALAHSSGAALRIARELIDQKLAGQEQVARHKLLAGECAERIRCYRSELAEANTLERVRLIESRAAALYWSAFRTLPIIFPRKDQRRTPAHWRVFGTRVSPLTGSPRLAVNPPNAILNYLYSLLESESRLAAACLGLDPGFGMLHVDTKARDSLACDLMEPVRPQVDAFLLDWIMREPIKREWLFEQSDGNCRLMAPFAARLSETAPMWGLAVAPFAEWVAREFWKTVRKPGAPLATRLTQNNKRVAKGLAPKLVSGIRPYLPHVCSVCGKTIEREHDYCRDCAAKNSTACLISGARLGRVAAQSAQAQERRKETKRRHDLARSHWSPSNQPAWFNEETYTKRILPALGSATLSQIAATIGVSIPYASDIRRGRRLPHARHWHALAKLVHVSPDA